MERIDTDAYCSAMKNTLGANPTIEAFTTYIAASSNMAMLVADGQTTAENQRLPARKQRNAQQLAGAATTTIKLGDAAYAVWAAVKNAPGITTEDLRQPTGLEPNAIGTILSVKKSAKNSLLNANNGRPALVRGTTDGWFLIEQPAAINITQAQQAGQPGRRRGTQRGRATATTARAA